MADQKEMSEEDAMAAAMAAAASGGGEAASPMVAEDGRVLSQDEIDSLLGFDTPSASDGNSNTGIKAILEKALMAYERLPMLEIVFDRLVRMASTNLRNFTSDNVDVNIDSMTSLRFGDYLNSIPLPALLVVFKAQEWENFGIITIDSSLIYSVVDVLLGGRRSNRPVRIEGRPYTTIEQDLIKRLADIILSDMSAAFDPVSPVTFQFERLETNPRFATIARPANAAILIRLRVDMDERGGNLEILFPHATLEPVRDLLLQMFMGEKFGRDSVWETYMTNEVKHTAVTVEAVIGEKVMSLSDVLQFQVGSTLMLETKRDDDIVLRAGGVKLMSASLGKLDDKISVKIKELLTKKNGESK
ncbi:MAG: flagellar motor switch protein FliM [Alphaproteobacteria bacterium]|nr:flagellar motor switch protein FliM [Alphaproteobacteria bacterium]